MSGSTIDTQSRETGAGNIQAPEPQSAQHTKPLHRWLALAIVVVEAIAVGYLSRTVVYPGLIVCVAAFGVLSRLRFEMDRQRTYDIIALMAVVFVIKYMVTPDNPQYLTLFPSQQLAFAIAQYVLAMQCVQFFVKRREDRLPFGFSGLGVVALVCAAMVSLSSAERTTVQGMFVAFTILAVLHCDASRTFIRIRAGRRIGRPLATIIVLVLVATLGWGSASAMFRYERHVEEFVNRYLEPQQRNDTVGFSETASLGSVSIVKNRSSQDAALRVVSTLEPGYFRLRVYDVYENGKWLVETVGRSIAPAAEKPSPLLKVQHEGKSFRIHASEDQSGQVFEVWPESDFIDTYAAPLGTSWLVANADAITVDKHGIIRSNGATPGVPYSLLAGRVELTPPDGSAAAGSGSADRSVSQQRPPESGSADGRGNRLIRPPNWIVDHAELNALAESLFRDCQSTADRINAVERYFHHNYGYSLEVRPPATYVAESDPLAWFLLEQPAAHCEYFASGAAVLLRMGGVPCRYVTGFVVSEQNEYSGDWLARNEDAHAWVEAWDDDQGWVTVEATPAAGVPHEQQTSRMTQFREYLGHSFQRLRVVMQQHGVSYVSEAVSSFAQSLFGKVTVSIFLLGLLVFFWRRSWHGQGMRNSLYAESRSEFAAAHRALARLDRAVQKAWRVRGAGETLKDYSEQMALQFSSPQDPLVRAADWYADYSQVRYSPCCDSEALQRLIEAAAEITRDIKPRVAGQTSERAGIT